MATNSFGLVIEPSVQFEITNATMFLEHSADASTSVELGLQVRLARLEHVSHTDGRSLDNIEWSMRLFRRSKAVSQEWLDANSDSIGEMRFYGEDRAEEGCQMDVLASDEMFVEIRRALLTSIRPLSLSIDVSGMTYGAGIDGHEKIWNREAMKNPKIRSIRMQLPMIAGDTVEDGFPRSESRDLVRDTQETAFGAKQRETSNLLAQLVSEFASAKASIATRLLAIFWVLVLGFGALLWFR